MIIPEIIKIAQCLKRQMSHWRESFDYNTIETFVGCTLADMLLAELITPDEERYLRKFLLEK